MTQRVALVAPFSMTTVTDNGGPFDDAVRYIRARRELAASLEAYNAEVARTLELHSVLDNHREHAATMGPTAATRAALLGEFGSNNCNDPIIVCVFVVAVVFAIYRDEFALFYMRAAWFTRRLLHTARRWMRALERFTRERQEPEPENAAKTDAASGTGERSVRRARRRRDIRCGICMDAETDTALIPCGHTCCAACAPKIVAKCPWCQTRPYETLRLYL
jgi:Zinc finger, C3HC4 type (RING finger)